MGVLERMRDGKGKVDWGDMNIELCCGGDVWFNNGKVDEGGFKVDGMGLEVLGGFDEKLWYDFGECLNEYSSGNIGLDNVCG